MDMVWRWRWAGSWNGNGWRRRNGCSINHVLYDARGLVNYHDISSTTVRLTVASTTIGL
jgi:hypothetical protein